MAPSPRRPRSIACGVLPVDLPSTSTERNHDISSLPQWRQADDQVFVATIAGEYAGFIAHTPTGVEAHGPLGESLGLHSTADQARDILTGHHIHAVLPRPRRPRRILRRGTLGRSSAARHE